MLALFAQLVAVLALRHRLGKTWLRRPVVLLVLASVVYNGLSQVLLSIPSIGQWNIYRRGVPQSFADRASLIMSAGMLAFTACYLLTRPEQARAVPGEHDVRVAARVLDWRLLGLACAPLAVLTYEGRGYNNGTLAAGAGASGATDLASAFFVILVLLASFSFVLSREGRRLVPVLAVQSLLLAAAGERTPVISCAIALVLLLAYAGYRPSRRQLRAAAGLTVLVILSISGVRAEQGRMIFSGNTGLGARLSALGSGLSGLGATSSGDSPGLLAQTAVRLDGTDFAGAILQAESFGQPRLSAAAVPESALIAVPSALWPSKLDHALNPVQAEMQAFGLRQVNFLPGLAGLYAGFLAWPWLIVFLAFLGAVGGRAERWLLWSWTPARTVMLAGALIAALSYERGLPGLLVAFRPAVAIALAVIVAMAARRPVPAQAIPSPPRNVKIQTLLRARPRVARAGPSRSRGTLGRADVIRDADE